MSPIPSTLRKGASPAKPKRYRNPFTLDSNWGRVLLLSCVIGSLSLLWWSVQRLTPVRTRAEDLSRTILQVTTDLEAMGSKWSVDGAHELLEDLDEQSAQRLFNDHSLSNWMAELRLQTIPLVLDTSIQVGAHVAASTNANSPVILPITFDVTPRPDMESSYSPYQRLLRFLFQLSNSQKRVDLVELEVHGQTNSIRYAQALLHLWMEKPPQ
jgi:hypothetical protein